MFVHYLKSFLTRYYNLNLNDEMNSGCHLVYLSKNVFKFNKYITGYCSIKFISMTPIACKVYMNRNKCNSSLLVDQHMKLNTEN